MLCLEEMGEYTGITVRRSIPVEMPMQFLIPLYADYIAQVVHAALQYSREPTCQRVR